MTRFLPCTVLVFILATGNLFVGFGANDVQVGGFVSAGYLDSSHYNYLVDSEDGSFEFVEMGVNASWTVQKRTTLNGQLFAFELGKYGNYEPLIDYLFVDYNFRREFGVHVGRVKREIGVYTHVQDIDLSRASILLPMGVYDPRFRDNSASLDGLSVYGNSDLWDGAFLDYSLYVGGIDLEPDGGIAGAAATSFSRIADNVEFEYVNSKYNYGGQIWLHPGVDGLRVGLGAAKVMGISAATRGTVSTDFIVPSFRGLPFRGVLGDHDQTRMIGSIEYYFDGWSFLGEYSQVSRDAPYCTDIQGVPVSSGLVRNKNEAWYISGARTLGRFEVLLTYTEYYEDKDNHSGAGLTIPSTAYNKDAQLSVRFDMTDHWSVKAEIHRIKGTSRLFNQYHQNPVLDRDRWSLFAAKSTFSF